MWGGILYSVQTGQGAFPHAHGMGSFEYFQQHPENQRSLRGTDPKLWPGHDPAIAFDSAEDVVAAAQLGMIELHTWNSTDRAIRQPDRMIFDMIGVSPR